MPEFEYPWLLWLAPLPLLMYLLPAQRREEAALRVPFFREVSALGLSNPGSPLTSPLKQICLWLIWLCCVTAAANPQRLGEPVSLPMAGRDLMLAVDLSESMYSRDMVFQGQRIDRLTAVKLVVGSFVEQRLNDRLGLILFGTRAYVQAPLTFDRNTVGNLLLEAQIGMAGPSTAIGDAIGLAVKRLQNQQAESRVLVLLTDGANTDGELTPQQAADLAAQFNVKIYTIGFGSNDREIDIRSLIEVAERTGGQSFRARNLQQLAEIHEELNRLEPVDQDAETVRPVYALFYWPLGAAFVLSLLLAGVPPLMARLSNALGNREASL
jgi:Ca-activated chloride channel family protein